ASSSDAMAHGRWSRAHRAHGGHRRHALHPDLGAEKDAKPPLRRQRVLCRRHGDERDFGPCLRRVWLCLRPGSGHRAFHGFQHRDQYLSGALHPGGAADESASCQRRGGLRDRHP
ncbi:unnamed protein product, partial [Effrenium voratum]